MARVPIVFGLLCLSVELDALRFIAEQLDASMDTFFSSGLLKHKQLLEHSKLLTEEQKTKIRTNFDLMQISHLLTTETPEERNERKKMELAMMMFRQTGKMNPYLEAKLATQKEGLVAQLFDHIKQTNERKENSVLRNFGARSKEPNSPADCPLQPGNLFSLENAMGLSKLVIQMWKAVAHIGRVDMANPFDDMGNFYDMLGEIVLFIKEFYGGAKACQPAAIKEWEEVLMNVMEFAGQALAFTGAVLEWAPCVKDSTANDNWDSKDIYTKVLNVTSCDYVWSVVAASTVTMAQTATLVVQYFTGSHDNAQKTERNDWMFRITGAADTCLPKKYVLAKVVADLTAWAGDLQHLVAGCNNLNKCNSDGWATFGAAFSGASALFNAWGLQFGNGWKTTFRDTQVPFEICQELTKLTAAQQDIVSAELTKIRMLTYKQHSVGAQNFYYK